ncbi:MAG: SdrD B-like domain-containing protein [Bacteroidota bacterium]
MNHFYRVWTFVFCLMAFHVGAAPPPIEEDFFTLCADRSATNTTLCMEGRNQNTKYGGYLLFEGLDSYYKIENGRFQEFVDGTAQLTGLWINNSRSDVRFEVDIRFSGRTQVAPNTPKSHECLDVDPTDFYYYTETSGTLIGKNKVAGAKLSVSRVGEAFQVGIGANVTNKDLNFGASGWLKTTLLSQSNSNLKLKIKTSSAGGNGDVNINLDGRPTACFESKVELDCPDDIAVTAEIGATGQVVTWTPPVGTTTCTVPTGQTCPPNNLDDFEFLGSFNNSRYYCSKKDNFTWLKAKELAEQAGGHLAVICSAEENEFLRQGLMADFAWIGFADNEREGDFRWVTGENCGYTNWRSGEPNNNGGDEDFTRILKSNGKWTDRDEHFHAEFILEIPCQNTVRPGEVMTTQIEGPAPGSTFPEGTTTIKYETVDECGNMEMCSFTVTVTIPVDPCLGDGSPQVVVEKTDPDCGQNNGKIKFTFDDNPNRSNIEFSLDGGQTYPLNVRDNAGMAMFSDLAPGDYDLAVRWGNDDCPVDLGQQSLIDIRKNPGETCNDNDPNTLNDVITADGCGCEGTPRGEITLICSGDIESNALPNLEGLVVNYEALTVSTTCGVDDNVSIELVEGLASGSFFPIGITKVKYVVKDACGNEEMCMFTVKVNRTVIPCVNQIVIQNKVCDDNNTLNDKADDTYTFDVFVERTGGAATTFTGTFSNPTLGAFQFGGNYGEAVKLGPFPTLVPNDNQERGLDITVFVQDADNVDCTDEVVVTSTGSCSFPLPNGAIGDLVFLDTDKDGIQDDGEAGIAGVEVKLLDANDTVLAIDTTDDQGKYFFDVEAGTYKVMVNVPSRFAISPTNQGNDEAKDSDIDGNGMTDLITVNSDEFRMDIDAGLNEIIKVKVGDFVFLDKNGNGIQDTEDEGIKDIYVGLYDGNGTLLSFTLTDENGMYMFSELDPGQYQLEFKGQGDDLEITAANQGNDDKDSDVNPNGFTEVFTLTSGFDDTRDAGFKSKAPTPCLAKAGTLTIDATPVELDNGAAKVSATPNGDVVVPDGFQTIFVLTKGTELVIEQVSATPEFTITEAGKYTIHTLVYDPTTLDLSIVVFGITTGVDVNGILQQGGGTICGSLDVAGAMVMVMEPVPCLADAGTLTIDATPVELADGAAKVSATPNGDVVVPSGFQTIFVLTKGMGLVIEQVNASPEFTVTEAGKYTIHTLVYDPSTLDLSIVVFGVTTGINVNGLLQQGGGTICASLDVAGAMVTVAASACDAVTATVTDGKLTIGGLVGINAKVEVLGSGTNWIPELVCGDGGTACSTTEMVSNLAAGNYVVKVQLWGADGSYCYTERRITIPEGNPSCAVTAGSISSNGDISDICVNDDEPNAVTFSVSGGSGNNVAWVVTDGAGNILNPDAPATIDFEGSGAGACNIYYVWYNDIEGLVVDANIRDLTGCFQLSNRITVTRTENCGTSGTPPCEEVQVTVGNEKISLLGLTAPFVVVKVHDINDGWRVIEECIDCENPTIFNVPAGDYNVAIQFYEAPWQNRYCQRDIMVTVTSEGDPTCTDDDEDGVCVEEDCDDTNPAIGAKQTPGTRCDDGNDNTINDEIQSDGCSCAGEVPSDKEICIERDVTNTDNCQFNIIYGLYLKLDGYDEYYTVSNTRFVEYTDGTASFTATAINNTTPEIAWEIDAQFGERTTLATEAPKAHNCLAASTDDYYFYETLTGTLTGMDAAAGAKLDLMRIGPAFQLGVAANITHKEFVFGGSGWFTAEILSQPTDIAPFVLNAGAQGQNGDFNINLSGDGTKCIEGRNNDALNCDNVSALATTDGIIVNGLTAPIEIIKIFDANWGIIDECTGDCGDSFTTTAGSGDYQVVVNFYTANWVGECEMRIPVTVPASATAANSRTANQLEANAFNNSREITVEWVTNTGYKNDRYVIEKSDDGEHFTAINDIQNVDATNDLTYYKDVDAQPNLGANYYRIKQIYQDGTFDYSEVQLVNFNIDLQSLAVFPNPAQEEVFVNLKSHAGKKANIQIVNTYGQVVQQLEIDELPQQPVRINLDNFQNGLYHLTIQMENTSRVARKILVNRLY